MFGLGKWPVIEKLGPGKTTKAWELEREVVVVAVAATSVQHRAEA
jgi:hypothetical protein